MSDTPAKRKTPNDATEFEREQLRHLLTTDDLTATLVEINPSLAWLPVIGEMKLITSGAQLAPWVEKNFGEIDAVKDVAANIQFFNEDTAQILENGLNRRAGDLSPLLLRSWRLIIRSLREGRRGRLYEWFELAPRIKGGEHSREVIDRLAEALRPKLAIRGRHAWHTSSGSDEPQRPSDLMSIEYKIDDEINDRDVLEAWPENASAADDTRLLNSLMDALDRALGDATDAGVESERGYSISDSDVPSVAQHFQNEYHDGFMAIVRVAAEIWTRLAAKDATLANQFVDRWYPSALKLIRRIALFAGANVVVPASRVVDMLTVRPDADWFVASSSVEVYRLLRIRWADLSGPQRAQIEAKIAEGPPADLFREGADLAEVSDRYKFDLLGDLQRRGLNLSEASTSLLEEIRLRHPQWSLREPEQAGFHIWVGGVESGNADPASLNNVPDDQLVERAEALQAEDVLQSDVWNGLVQSDPSRALRGLVAEAAQDRWPAEAWQSFLWAAPKIVDPLEVAALADLLQRMPDAVLTQISAVAAFWMNDKAKEIGDAILWPLWDRLFALTASGNAESATMRDALTDSINSPSGRLAEIVLKKVVKADAGQELPENIELRLERLIRAGGQFGALARVRLAADVSFLYEIAPSWTTANVIPLFDWTSNEALGAWSARRYSRFIGSPALVRLLKGPYLELFGRSEVPNEDIRVYADWLAAILLAAQSGAVDFPITPTEARSALRKAGDRALPSFAHRLAVEIERSVDGDKIETWRTAVGPVFRNVWPLDVDLQSSASTFKLVQILMGSGAAFSEAASSIIPFVRVEELRSNTTVFNISRAPDIVYQSSPDKMLDLLDAVVGNSPPRSVHGLTRALERLKEIKPAIADLKKFQHLTEAASVY